ncbi:MAG: amidohydrolase family protein [Pseudomonadota bacterium]
MLIKRAEINGNELVDVWVKDGRIADVRPAELSAASKTTVDVTIDASGCCVLPGLHDHHFHFFALLAHRSSIDCSGDLSQIERACAQAPGNGWLRGVGYHEHAAGELDRASLSAVCPDRPLRLQHSSGKLWVLNDLGIELLNLMQVENPGVERDYAGEPTGRLFRMDDWLRVHVPSTSAGLKDRNALVNELYAYGITGFTDTSYSNDQAQVDELMRLDLDVYCMGNDSLADGHLKIMLDEDRLPDIDFVIQRVCQAHDKSRNVAFHCVSHVELLYLLEVMEQAGSSPGDRIEHGGVIPAELVSRIGDLGMTVVTQPGFLADRGGRFLDRLPADQHCDLYPYRRLLEAGIPVVASSDAPYGPLSPWEVTNAAMTRRTEDGRIANGDECVDFFDVIRGYLTYARSPGRLSRQIAQGVPANLCILDCRSSELANRAGDNPVRHTVFNGELVYSRDDRIS